MSHYLRLYVTTEDETLRELLFHRIINELPLSALFEFIYEGKLP